MRTLAELSQCVKLDNEKLIKKVEEAITNALIRGEARAEVHMSKAQYNRIELEVRQAGYNVEFYCSSGRGVFVSEMRITL